MDLVSCGTDLLFLFIILFLVKQNVSQKLQKILFVFWTWMVFELNSWMCCQMFFTYSTIPPSSKLILNQELVWGSVKVLTHDMWKVYVLVAKKVRTNVVDFHQDLEVQRWLKLQQPINNLLTYRVWGFLEPSTYLPPKLYLRSTIPYY